MRAAFLAAGLALGLLAAGPAAADEPGRISVIGRASAEVPADTASVEIAVERRAPSAAAALDRNSEAARKVAAFAKEFGAEVATTAVTLRPVTRPSRDPNGAEVPDGYQASNAVQIRLADLGRLGELMRRTLDGGADRIGGVTFGLRDAAKAEGEARAAAVKDAIRQAETLAEAAGLRLGRIERIVSPARSEVPVYAGRAFAAKARAPSVPVEAGTVEVGATVEITWVIAQ
ncbi:SIMPL domain-containing protein [Methylobacterium sp. ID0610]|uniref:SIMPL domain-containing protein n=1 Tax=Methylobacterium carpenticola TaxID=3344827 RepID=UPI0036B594CA